MKSVPKMPFGVIIGHADFSKRGVALAEEREKAAKEAAEKATAAMRQHYSEWHKVPANAARMRFACNRRPADQASFDRLLDEALGIEAVLNA